MISSFSRSTLAFIWEKTLRAEAATLRTMAVTLKWPPASSTLLEKRFRSCSNSVISALSNWVTWGMAFQERPTCSAVVLRTFVMGRRSTAPHLEKSGRIIFEEDFEAAPEDGSLLKKFVTS